MKKLLLGLGTLAAVVAPVAAVIACGSTDPVDQVKSQYKDMINKYATGATKTDLLAKLDKVKTQEDLTKFATDADFVTVQAAAAQAVIDAGKAKITTPGSGTTTTQTQVDAEQTVIAALTVNQIDAAPTAQTTKKIFAAGDATKFGVVGFVPKTAFVYNYTSTATELTITVSAGSLTGTPSVFTLDIKAVAAAPDDATVIAALGAATNKNTIVALAAATNGISKIVTDLNADDAIADSDDVTVTYDDGTTKTFDYDGTSSKWVLHII